MSDIASPLPPPPWTPPVTVAPPDVTQGPPLPGLPVLDVPPPPPSVPTVPSLWPPPTNARGPETPTIAPQAPCADCDTGDNDYPTGDRWFARSRLRPENEIGPGGTGSGGGVTLGSRNYNWQLGLLSMPGRAGFDVNLTLFYNSLVWVRQGNFIKFNPDRSFPGPGFNLGLPHIEPAGGSGGAWNAYLLQRPDGGRVELLRNETTLYHEATDGSHVKALMQGGDSTGYGATSGVVWWSDGTKMTFATYNGKLYPTVITDRNGNQITAAYDNLGHLTQITDTANRSFYFNYDSNKNLISIKQPRTPGADHVWAEFSYTTLTLTPDFGTLQVNMPANPTISVLQRVKLPDGTAYTFDYNAYGQVKKFSRYATDSSASNRLMSYLAYDLSDTGTLNDCPRFTAQRVWGRSANGDREGTPTSDGSEDTVTTFAVDPSSANGTQPAWSSFSTPDGTYYKEIYDTSTTWRRGLAVRSEIRVGNLLRKWVTTEWTQDDLNAYYPNNPRPAVITVYDGVNGSDGTERRRRTVLSYTNDAYHLPQEVKEYDNTLTNLIRRTRTDYQLDEAYTSRNLIGLTAQRQVWDGGGNLLSKTTYSYDWDYEHLIETPAGVTVTQRTAGYGLDYRIGRGNLCQVVRWDVTTLNTNNPEKIESKLGYDTTGNVRLRRDPRWRQTFFDYSDRTAEGYTNSNQQSYLYATRVTDPLQSVKPAGEQKHAYAGYDYYTGQIRKTEGLPAAGQEVGAVQSYTYDTVGRLAEALTALGTESDYARVYYGYMPTEGMVDVQRKISPTTYALTRQIANGLGQVYVTGGTHPGSTGGYRAQQLVYDRMGRVIKRSNPTETNKSWVPIGEDAAGWVWTEQAYDWQGRPIITTNPDGTQRTTTYGGCGCAGRLEVTTRDEAGRRRRYAQDALGRLAQTQELNWDSSVYATTTYAYNALDQITELRQNAAGATADNARVRTFAYDGHGRLKERTTPEQGLTKFTYNVDDTINTLTDARNAVTTYSYEPRGLVERLTYTAPQGVTATPLTTFAYDTAGNRTGMVTMGVGTVNYVYDQLSRPTSETHGLDGAGTYTLNYQWGRSGTLTSMTNATLNTTVSYNYNAADELTSVQGSGEKSVPSYAGNIKYRAFGAPSQITYGNTRQLALGYNQRLFLTSWNLPQDASNNANNNASNSLGYDYSYTLPSYTENTGRVSFAQSRYDNTLDRTWLYDQVGRLGYAYTAADARSLNGGPAAQQHEGPYAQEYKYDVWGNMTQRVGWGGEHANYSAGFTTKNQKSGFQYDESGNLLNDGGQNYAYDVQGQQTFASIGNLTQTYDGDGLRVKKVENGAPTWYLRSAVLGNQVIAEIGLNNVWQKGYIYAGGQLLAIQDVPNNRVLWTHQEPYTKGQRITDAQGNIISGIELDPYGGETNRNFDPASVNQQKRYTSYTRDGNRGDEAMMRRYERWHSRFYQPDPYDGSLSPTDPQSFNRYAYSGNDPVNFVDPTGLLLLPSGNGPGGRCIQVPNGENTGVAHYICFNMTIGTGGGSFNVPSSGGGDEPNPEHEKKCRSLKRAIKSHNAQVQRHLKNYGNDLTKWKASQPPYNYLVGQLGDYQRHVDQYFGQFFGRISP